MHDVSRSIAVKLGEGDARLTLELTGAPCQVDDLALELRAYVSHWLRERQARPRPADPCGCQEK
jgi:hypothetical protein